MWRNSTTSESKELLRDAIRFTGDAKLYGSFMLKVAREWKYSCEHNLTDLNQNRRAWIGHAAAAMAIGCPEHITRSAWRELSQKQQDEANAVADVAISAWERENAG